MVTLCMPEPLPKEFYLQNTEYVARQLIGCILSVPGYHVRLTETEAYLPANDAACHASRGITRRNAPMFNDGGILYLYLIYGLHWCCNIVTEPAGLGAAVLLRAGIVGTTLADLVPGPGAATRLISGPGRLTRHLRLDGRQNCVSVLGSAGFSVQRDIHTDTYQQHIQATPRIGITHGREHLLRFVVDCS